MQIGFSVHVIRWPNIIKFLGISYLCKMFGVEE